MTTARAQEIVAEEFTDAGWNEHERPALSEDGTLSDGNHWEPARLDSEQHLRDQCRAWIYSVEQEQ